MIVPWRVFISLFPYDFECLRLRLAEHTKNQWTGATRWAPVADPYKWSEMGPPKNKWPRINGYLGLFHPEISGAIYFGPLLSW